MSERDRAMLESEREELLNRLGGDLADLGVIERARERHALRMRIAEIDEELHIDDHYKGSWRCGGDR